MSQKKALKYPDGIHPLIWIQRNYRTPDGKLIFRSPRSKQDLDPDRKLEDNEEFFSSAWPILPKEINVQAFLEYERSFGKRLFSAFDFTHGPGMRFKTPTLDFLKNNGSENPEHDRIQYIKDYDSLASKIEGILVSDNEEEIRKYIEEIKRFRENYNWMYFDVEPLRENTPRIKIKTIPGAQK
jgi:hypothetical protein